MSASMLPCRHWNQDYVACIQVAKIVAVDAVEGSSKLWKCMVDVGDVEPRQIVAGLQQHIPREVMLGLTAVTICNLKPAKLAGQLSEGMLLAASSVDTGFVRTLQPPEGAEPGDPVRSTCCLCFARHFRDLHHVSCILGCHMWQCSIQTRLNSACMDAPQIGKTSNVPSIDVNQPWWEVPSRRGTQLV
jgi:methionine--tRNA ligase beta chain